jgi:hypothetical protein
MMRTISRTPRTRLQRVVMSPPRKGIHPNRELQKPPFSPKAPLTGTEGGGMIAWMRPMVKLLKYVTETLQR